MIKRHYLQLIGLDFYTPPYQHQGGGEQENVCSQWEISEEENGEVIATNGYHHYRTESRAEAVLAVEKHLASNLQAYRECYIDDAPDYKNRD